MGAEIIQNGKMIYIVKRSEEFPIIVSKNSTVWIDGIYRGFKIRGVEGIFAVYSNREATVIGELLVRANNL